MNLDRVNAGRELPNDFNVIIEIPMNADPIKYEVDKETGAIFVDRFMSTAMHYPCNYGYIPGTLSGDGDPVDVIVLSPVPVITGVIVRCRPVGMLKMEDEAGDDTKLLAVPIDRICALYRGVATAREVPQGTLDQIRHFSSITRILSPARGCASLGGSGRRKRSRKYSTGSPAFAAQSASRLRGGKPPVSTRLAPSAPPVSRKARCPV